MIRAIFGKHVLEVRILKDYRPRILKDCRPKKDRRAKISALKSKKFPKAIYITTSYFRQKILANIRHF